MRFVSTNRDLLGLDTPPHCLMRCQSSCRDDYCESSGFSPVTKDLSENLHVRKCTGKV